MAETYGFRIEVEGNAVKSISGIDTAFHKLDTDSQKSMSNVKSHVGEMHEKMKGMMGGMKGLILGATGLGSIFGGFELAKESLEVFDKREESLAKLESALQSTGHAAGLTAEELEKMASVQSGKELFSKSAIIDAQSMLLTFTQIKGKVFDEAMPAILNFATRFKMELPEAANMVGKALNDPLKGMTRLQRQGVVFSAQQKEQIKNFMAVGNIAAAQGVIIHELGTEFGGLSEAMAKTDAGKLKMATKSIEEMKVGIGKLLSEGLSKLAPAITGIGDLFHKAFGHDISKDMEEAKTNINALFETVKNSNVPLDERREAMNRLNSEYRDYLPYILTDKMTTEQLAQAQSDSNVQMIRKIELQIKQESLEKIQKEYAKVEKERGGKQTAYNKAQIEYQDLLNGREAELEKYRTSRYKKGGDQMSEYARQKQDEESENYRMARGNYDRQIANAKSTMDKARGKLSGSIVELSDARHNFELDMKYLMGNNYDPSKLNKIGLSATVKEQMDSLDQFSKGGKAGGGGALAANATNTSLLGGASGGLGEAKQIHITFNKPMLEVNVPGGNGQDIVNKAPMTANQLLRILNNMSMTQSGTM
jgi:Ni/Co efflux regulator RcnB